MRLPALKRLFPSSLWRSAWLINSIGSISGDGSVSVSVSVSGDAIVDASMIGSVFVLLLLLLLLMSSSSVLESSSSSAVTVDSSLEEDAGAAAVVAAGFSISISLLATVDSSFILEWVASMIGDARMH